MREPAVVAPGAAPPASGPWVLAVPGVEAPAYAFDLPPGVPRPARRRVAAQQLRDRIGRDAARLALVPLAAPGRAGWTRALAADRDALRAWADEAGPRCVAVLPDWLTLPAAPGLLSLDAADGILRARLGVADGFSAPLPLALPLLRAALAAGGLGAVRASGVPAGLLDEIAALGPAAADGPAPGAPAARRFAHGELEADLRRGLAAGEDARLPGLGLWAAAALAGLAAFGLWASSVALETRAAQAEARALAAETEAVLRRGLLPEGPLLDIRAQVARRLAAADGPAEAAAGDPLALLSDLTVALFGTGLDVTEIALDATGATLDLVAPDFAAARGAEELLAGRGLSVTPVSARARDAGGVEARLRVEAGR